MRRLPRGARSAGRTATAVDGPGRDRAGGVLGGAGYAAGSQCSGGKGKEFGHEQIIDAVGIGIGGGGGDDGGHGAAGFAGGARDGGGGDDARSQGGGEVDECAPPGAGPDHFGGELWRDSSGP